VIGYKNWDTILKCDIFGYPSPVIKWTRSRKELPINRHIIDDDTLTIKNTREEDGGAYLCEGENQLGSVIAVTWIIVKDVGKLRIFQNIYVYIYDTETKEKLAKTCYLPM